MDDEWDNRERVDDAHELLINEIEPRYARVRRLLRDADRETLALMGKIERDLLRLRNSLPAAVA